MRLNARLFFLLLLAYVHTTYAQYPFEKYPAIKYAEYKHWTMGPGPAMFTSDDCLSHYQTISPFFPGESITIRLVSCDSTSYIYIYKGKHQLQAIPDKMSFFEGNLSEPIRIADFNGDGLKDIKLVVPYHGCGIASLNARVIYLFQRPGNRFVKIAYMDKIEHGNTPERDMDKDGNYEIITMDLQGYKTHNYWTFNSYNFKDNNLVNVNDKFGYPIMVQYLNRDNYTPTNIDKNNLKKYSLKVPQEYEVKK